MRRGFTLIELIIVIALIAVVGALVVVNAQAIFRGLGEEPADRILQKAVREARYQAASLKESVYLSYDEERGALLIQSEAGSDLASFKLPPENGGDPAKITFDQVLPGTGLVNNRTETSPVPHVVFRPDRSSTPFSARITAGSTDFTQRYDPFSAIVINDSRNP